MPNSWVCYLQISIDIFLFLSYCIYSWFYETLTSVKSADKQIIRREVTMMKQRFRKQTQITYILHAVVTSWKTI